MHPAAIPDLSVMPGPIIPAATATSRRIRTALAALAFASVITGPTAAHSDARFEFQVPPGWTDLSPGAPAENFAKAPSQMVAMLRGRSFRFVAAELSGADDGFIENVNVSIVAGRAEPVTESALTTIAVGMRQEFVGRGGTYRVLEQRLVEIQGVTCGRIVAEMTSGTTRVRQVLYLLPGDEGMAVATYSTTPEAFSRYEAVFDRTARMTRGISAPIGFFGRVLRATGGGAATGAVTGVVVALATAVVLGLLKWLQGKRSSLR